MYTDVWLVSGINESFRFWRESGTDVEGVVIPKWNLTFAWHHTAFSVHRCYEVTCSQRRCRMRKKELPSGAEPIVI
jgi:hypothetical protein